MVIAEYSSCVKENLENFLARPKSQTISFAPFINYCRHLKKRLETQSESTTFISFVNGSDICNIRLAATEHHKINYALWHRHCWLLKIKYSIPAACFLYKYIWKVILYMVLIGNERLKSNI